MTAMFLCDNTKKVKDTHIQCTLEHCHADITLMIFTLKQFDKYVLLAHFFAKTAILSVRVTLCVFAR